MTVNKSSPPFRPAACARLFETLTGRKPTEEEMVEAEKILSESSNDQIDE
jgi:hypothetical protein